MGMIMAVRTKKVNRPPSREKAKTYADLISRRGWTHGEKMVDPGREPFLILDADLRVVVGNEAFYRTFETSANETEGKILHELGNGQWANPKLRDLLQDVLTRET